MEYPKDTIIAIQNNTDRSLKNKYILTLFFSFFSDHWHRCHIHLFHGQVQHDAGADRKGHVGLCSGGCGTSGGRGIDIF